MYTYTQINRDPQKHRIKFNSCRPCIKTWDLVDNAHYTVYTVILTVQLIINPLLMMASTLLIMSSIGPLSVWNRLTRDYKKFTT